MSRIFLLFMLLVAAAALIAAPVPPPPERSKPLTDEQRVEAQIFAPILINVCNQIVDQYVRPVAQHELVFAALSGLYEKAQRPAPATLHKDCEVAVDQAALVKLVLTVREDIGDAEGLQGTHPVLICCQAMARFLDPYTGVVSGEDQRRNTALEQDVRGVGLEIGDNPGNGPVFVKMVKPGGPAQRAGMRPGDEITHIDGLPVSKIPAEKLLETLNQIPTQGPPGLLDDQQAPAFTKPVRLKIRRTGDAVTKTMSLEPQCFRAETILGVSRNHDNSWNYWLDPKQRIAHLRLATIALGTANELRDAIDSLQQQQLRGLILDLRWCPGGFLDEAVDCARLFVGAGVVSKIKTRAREPIVHLSKEPGKFFDVPLVVLVNADTMGGGELIAAALQDQGRVLIAGQRTFGKASVQSPMYLGLPNMGMKLTTGTFERPNGKNLHRFPDSKPSDDWGVRPDAGLDFRVSPDLNRQLREWWLQMTLRPGSSRERLALDDQAVDGPQQAALRALQNLVEKKERAKSSGSVLESRPTE